MDRYVLDTTVLIQRLINQVHTPNAIALFNAGNRTAEYLVPVFGIIEAVNVLWKYVRFQGMPLTDAQVLVADMLDLPIQIALVDPILVSALNLGVKHQLSIYDSIYIALALAHHCPLITLDQKQGQIALKEGVPLKPLTDFSSNP